MDRQVGNDLADPDRRGTVVAAHARLASREQVIADRRMLYRLAVSLIGGDAATPVAVLDHPITRFRIGQLLAGLIPAARFEMPQQSDLLGGDVDAGAGPVVAGAPESVELLAPALRAIGSAGDVAAGTLGLITGADGDRFGAAAAGVRAGAVLARRLVPDLMADLEGHVALVGVLDPRRSGAVVSASSRFFPGLVLLRPGAALDVAESLVHEAAHQRLFDMAITRDLLRAEADGQRGFRPTWRASVWPIEQTLAAFHAYACLAELARAVPVGELRTALGPHSVLPDAEWRTAEIGNWLADNADLLGSDAVQLVREILGRPAVAAAPIDPPPALLGRWTGRAFRAEDCHVVSAPDGRVLVGLAADPPRMFWLDSDASSVLRILRASASVSIEGVSIEGIVGEFEAMTGHDAFTRASAALNTLVQAELAVVS
jgi:hypothetical protein